MNMFPNKIAIVLNEMVTGGKAMAVLAHTMLGFGATTNKEHLNLREYKDASGIIHPNISEMPIMVYRGNSDQIRTMRKVSEQNGIEFVDFVDTMMVGTYEDEKQITSERTDDQLVYECIVLFGLAEKITEMTRDLELYK